MITKVIMPKLAANIEEATIGQWFRQEGEPVVAGEPLFEAITDKAAVEVKAEAAGTLRKVLAAANSVIPVGQVIAFIGEPGDALPEVAPSRPAPKHAEPAAVKASFGARRLAKEMGVDLATVKASRPDGCLTEDDVRRAAGVAEGPAVLERIPHSPLKRAVASHLARIAQQVVPAFVRLEVDFSAVERELPKVSQRAGVEVWARDVVIYAAARLLPGHRLLNAAFSDDAVVVYRPVNIGLAVDVERDSTVMVPVIRDADRKPLAEIAREAAGLAERARGHHIEPSELRDATFTIADHSALGVDDFVPVLNERQSAILALGTPRRRPVLRDGEVVHVPVASLGVVFDHRVLNATSAVRFLHALRDSLERFTAESVS